MQDSTLDDALSPDPVERLLEGSWLARSQAAGRRKVLVEAVAAALFLGIAAPLAAPALGSGGVPVGLALLLIALYALVAETIRFPIGRGYVVPTYLMLVPMLLLLPPETVPLLTAGALVAGTSARWALRRGPPERILFAIPDAWHALGPAVVLAIAGPVHGGVETVEVYLGALLAGCVVDLATSTAREAAELAVAPRLQIRVVLVIWLVDACIAPLGLLLARAARYDYAQLLIVLPLSALLAIIHHDRSARIAQAQRRLELVAHERSRLQAAVRRLGDAFAAKLDLPALITIVLHAAIDALDADAGRVTLRMPNSPPLANISGDLGLEALLETAGRVAQTGAGAEQLEQAGVWALALPFASGGDSGPGRGALAVARRGRQFRDDERALMHDLVDRAQTAVGEILAHDALREQTLTDPLTLLGNRRKLANDLNELLASNSATASDPIVLMLFDLDGFKNYNDTFGHLAGDELLARLGGKLTGAVSRHGTAYRLGGDEFCALLTARADQLRQVVAAAAGALDEHGATFSISASCGAVILPDEAGSPDYALQLADERMYARKHARPSAAREQTRDVLIRIMQAKQPGLPDHFSGVARLAVSVGRRLKMSAEQIDELARAAELQDIGNVGIPDAILAKPGELDADEWRFVRQHTILGERILSAAPALRPVATIVRASHERWDGHGYPDGLRKQEIPLAARIIAVCDAYRAITTDRGYRKARPANIARQELQEQAGTQFDPTVIAALLEELNQPQPPTPPTPGTAEDTHQQIADEIAHRFNQIQRVRLSQDAAVRPDQF